MILDLAIIAPPWGDDPLGFRHRGENPFSVAVLGRQGDVRHRGAPYGGARLHRPRDLRRQSDHRFNLKR
ncbi:MAG: hypothetical protein H2041_01445 [Phenylobacterium sp.]|uniref:hypothetical protein n=1 Tax=Phenylobacterium sp. TaxID=1871053 RepID=UPI0018219A5E|nr:hypothetical protein [Phenylobacterium sp.]MBA4792310.1 hypothetical protein [Phenylobacterium sp.]